MGYPLKQSQTARPLVFLMVSSTDHLAAATGLSPTVTLSKNGAAFASPAGAVTEIGSGWYKVAGNATDTNTLGPLLLHATGTGADPTDVQYQVVAYDPDNGTSLGLADLDAAISTRLPASSYTAPLGSSATAAAVWDEARSGHATAGSFGQGVASVQGNVTGSVASVSGSVTVGTNSDKAGYSLTAAERQATADALLDRDMGAGTDSGGRTVRNALRALRNKFSLSGGTRTVTKEDDLTTAWTSAYTTDGSALPIVADDPA